MQIFQSSYRSKFNLFLNIKYLQKKDKIMKNLTSRRHSVFGGRIGVMPGLHNKREGALKSRRKQNELDFKPMIKS